MPFSIWIGKNSILSIPVLTNVHDTMDCGLESIVGHSGHVLSHIDNQAVLNHRHPVPPVVKHQLQPRVPESLQEGDASRVSMSRTQDDCKYNSFNASQLKSIVLLFPSGRMAFAGILSPSRLGYLMVLKKCEPPSSNEPNRGSK